MENKENLVSFEKARANEKLCSSIMLIETLFGTSLKSFPDVYLKKPYPDSVVGFVTFDVKTAYFGEYMEYADHELIHCEDLFSLNDKEYYPKPLRSRSLLKNFWLEGRAVYGTKVLIGRTPKRTEIIPGKLIFPQYEIESIAKAIHDELPKVVSWLLKFFLKYKFGKLELRKYAYYFIENIYFKYYNSLCELEKAVGNPILAFRITNKFPKSWKAVFRPLEYYKTEIEQSARDINYKKMCGRLMKRYRTTYRNGDIRFMYDDY